MNKWILSTVGTLGILGFTAGLASAATDSDDVIITGTVQEVMTVAIAGGTPSFNITPGTAVTAQNLGTISINSNDPDGYIVTLTAANDGSVLANAGADETIAYTVSYNGAAAVGLSTDPTEVEDVTTQTTGSEDRTFTLTIAAGASTGRSAEAFTDTVTITITGNA